MRQRTCLFALLAALLLPATALSQGVPTPQYGVLGVGLKSCGTWTETRAQKGDDASTRMAWVGGFITAINSLSAGRESPFTNITQGTDAEGLWAWIDNYCAQHPLDPFVFAAQALVGELVSRVAPSSPTPEQ